MAHDWLLPLSGIIDLIPPPGERQCNGFNMDSVLANLCLVQSLLATTLSYVLWSIWIRHTSMPVTMVGTHPWVVTMVRTHSAFNWQRNVCGRADLIKTNYSSKHTGYAQITITSWKCKKSMNICMAKMLKYFFKIMKAAEEKYFFEKDCNWQAVNSCNSNGHLGQLS